MRTTTARPRVTGEAPPAWWRRKAVRRTVRWTAIGITVVLVAVTLGGYAFYEHLDANLNVVSITGIKNQPPPSAKGVENILVLGSQTRNGQTGGQAEFGTDPNTNLSDNIILFHLNATHTRATVISIPRDTIVYEPAGRHYITGNEALEFVRTRHGVGNGGDLGRIELQQEFISSLMQKVEQENLLADPVTLLKLADVATRDVTVDTGLGSVTALLKQAYGLRDLKTSDVTFVTMPTVADPLNQDRLLPEYPEDDIIWQMLRHDQTWDGRLPTPKLSTVDITVLNGTSQGGLAASTAKALRKLGFRVVSVGNAPAYTDTTTVSYTGSGQAEGAYALMSALKVVPTGANAGPPAITLTIGTNFGGVKSASLGISNNPDTSVGAAQQDGTAYSVVQTRSAAANICSGLPDSNPDTGTPP